MLLPITNYNGLWGLSLRVVNNNFNYLRNARSRKALRLLVMPQQRSEELGRLALQAIERKFRSVNNASLEIPADRQTLTRLTKGHPPRLDVFERIAIAVDADWPLWLRLSGYVPDTQLSPIDRLSREYGAIALECATRGKTPPDLAPFVRTYQGGFGALTDDEADRILEKIRKAAGLS